MECEKFARNSDRETLYQNYCGNFQANLNIVPSEPARFSQERLCRLYTGILIFRFIPYIADQSNYSISLQCCHADCGHAGHVNGQFKLCATLENSGCISNKLLYQYKFFKGHLRLVSICIPGFNSNLLMRLNLSVDGRSPAATHAYCNTIL